MQTQAQKPLIAQPAPPKSWTWWGLLILALLLAVDLGVVIYCLACLAGQSHLSHPNYWPGQWIALPFIVIALLASGYAMFDQKIRSATWTVGANAICCIAIIALTAVFAFRYDHFDQSMNNAMNRKFILYLFIELSVLTFMCTLINYLYVRTLKMLKTKFTIN